MDQLATLGITVSADGAIREVNTLNTSLDKLGATSVASTRGMSALNAVHAEAVGKVGAHTFGINRAERGMAGLIEKATGLNSALGIVGSSFLKFGVGDVYTIAIIAGIAAVTSAWDALTRSAREAGKAQENAVQSLARMIGLKAAGPGGQNVLDLGQASAQMQVLQAQRKLLVNEVSTAPGGVGLLKQGELEALDEEIANLAAVMRVTKGIISKNIRDEDAKTLGEAMRKEAESHRKLEEAARKAQEDFLRYREVLRQAYGNFPEFTTTAQRREDVAFERSPYYQAALQRAANDALGKDIQASITANAGTFSMPNTSVNDGLNKEQIKMREKMGILVDDGNKNTGILKSAIDASAGAIGQIVAQSLNIGGGGLGSAIGGAIGSGVGGGIGTKIGGGIGSIGGSFLGPVGAVLGGLIGSAIGGLFHHHKKAVDKNTDALNALTSALYNSPSGYKVAGARYRADDGRRIYEATSQEAYNRRLRGGVGSLAVA